MAARNIDTTFATQNSIDAEGDHGVNTPINVATISSGFEKGDFLVREEKGQRVYFDFFEEAFNYLANKGYARMKDADSEDWMDAGKYLTVYRAALPSLSFDYRCYVLLPLIYYVSLLLYE